MGKGAPILNKKAMERSKTYKERVEKRQALIDKIRGFAKEHEDGKIDMATIARKVGVSESTVRHVLSRTREEDWTVV